MGGKTVGYGRGREEGEMKGVAGKAGGRGREGEKAGRNGVDGGPDQVLEEIDAPAVGVADILRYVCPSLCLIYMQASAACRHS